MTMLIQILLLGCKHILASCPHSSLSYILAQYVIWLSPQWMCINMNPPATDDMQRLSFSVWCPARTTAMPRIWIECIWVNGIVSVPSMGGGSHSQQVRSPWHPHSCLLCAGYQTVTTDNVHGGRMVVLIDDSDVIRLRMHVGVQLLWHSETTIIVFWDHMNTLYYFLLIVGYVAEHQCHHRWKSVSKVVSMSMEISTFEH